MARLEAEASAFTYLLGREDLIPAPEPDYLFSHPALTWTTRGRIITSLLQEAWDASWPLEYVVGSINLLDRTMSLRASLLREEDEFEVLAASAMTIGFKFYDREMEYIIFQAMAAWLQIEPKTLLAQELATIDDLGFCIRPSNAASFTTLVLDILRKKGLPNSDLEMTRAISMCLVMRTLTNHEFLKYKPSQVGTQCVYLALHIHLTPLWILDISEYSGYTQEDLAAVRDEM